ncbi:iron-sulfur cluster assembly protein [Paenibacillus shirakamiensis]|uniref:Iron-sulfur cluster assembly protein n=1 Tax=Paenibacillus shirakamiensis TaxID=1265935 RepID=A0ABS4JK42_9BACL|nr:iron-sulfur cluster assembly accessory protein [Paenibacillus shirakamiensis]MBP2002077.1 iron-sulfur cluster assembly protein [Paenibacillus shirakamiensis]
MIEISDAAVAQIKEMLSQQETPNMFLRLGVQPGGCSGFSYGMGFDDVESEEDVYLEVADLKVVVDKESLKYLNGLEIDYEASGMSGGFSIHNPNAVATCGCGSSFRTKDDAGQPAEAGEC